MKAILIAILGGLLTPAAQDESENTTIERFHPPIVLQQQVDATTDIAPPAPSGRNSSVSSSIESSAPYEEVFESNESGYTLHEVNNVVGCTSNSRCQKGGHRSSKDRCGKCENYGCDDCSWRNPEYLHSKSSCNMPLHFAYFPDTHGYYYFLPYHHDHIDRHIGLISVLGGDKRAPYSSAYFAKFYTDVLGVDAKRPQKLPNLRPTSDAVNELPTLEELLKK